MGRKPNLFEDLLYFGYGFDFKQSPHKKLFFYVHPVHYSSLGLLCSHGSGKF